MAYKYGSNNGKDMEQKFILECIRLYRDLPALWNMKSKSYYERGKKNASYNILLKKYREVYPDATKLDIRKKFNVLRTNYRKEFRKQNSMNSYKPTLWYFNEFSFLNEQKPDIESSIDLSQEDGVSDSESSVSAEVLQNDNLIIKVEHDKETNTTIMPPKRKTKEEMLEKAKLARRKRYEKIKSDPTLYALEKEKERERYLKRKGQKKILSISDMTPRNRWLQREKWRENFRNYYRRKVVNRENETMNKDTPSCSDNEDSQESDGVDEGTDTARELNTNENVSQDLLIIRNPEPTISKVKQENRVEFEDSAYDKEVDNPKTPGKADNSEEEVLILANEDVSEKKDEHFYWAISCAADIRKMDHVQQIYAKKAIAEILMEGQLGLLHRNSMKLNELSSS